MPFRFQAEPRDSFHSGIAHTAHKARRRARIYLTLLPSRENSARGRRSTLTADYEKITLRCIAVRLTTM